MDFVPFVCVGAYWIGSLIYVGRLWVTEFTILGMVMLGRVMVEVILLSLLLSLNVKVLLEDMSVKYSISIGITKYNLSILNL